MQIGMKAQGQNHMAKLCAPHHTSRTRHGKARAIERAAERKVRQAGRKVCREAEG